MKIGFVLNQFPELSQSFVLNQVAGLMRRGHQVEVLAGRGGFAAELGTDFLTPHERQNLAQVTTWANMPARLPTRALRALGQAARRLPAYPRQVVSAFDPFRFGWFAASGTLFSLAEPLLGQPRRYDALIAHFGPQGVVAEGLRELELLEGPLLTFFHAYDLTSAPRLVGRRMYQNLFQHGEVFAAISERGKVLLEALGAPHARIHVHHMGIDLDHFTASAERSASAQLNLLSVGRLTEKKGFALAVLATAELARTLPNVRYRIVGEGRERPRLERLIAQLGLTGRVTLVGARSQHEILDLMRQAHIFVVPSITAKSGDEEGIPMVIMEALACKLPVVASRHGGIPELVHDGTTGVLTPEGDFLALFQALQLLAGDPSRRKRLGEAGRQLVEREFSLKTQLKRLETLLAGLV